MGPRLKRQRLSEDGTAAVTATSDTVHPSNANALEPAPKDEAVRKQNLSQRRSLFVRSLAPTVTTDDLTEYFSESYPIKHAIAVLDKETKEGKGFGFVTFADAEDAQRALEELNGTELKGKKIKIEIAEPRHRDVDSNVPGHKKSTPSAVAAKAKAEREQQRKEQLPPKLIIRNLPWTIKHPDQLAKLFQSYGKVKTVVLPKKDNGQLKGFGFVLLRGRKNAEKALGEINGKEVDGRTLAVDWAVDKETWQNIQQNAEKEDADMPDADESEADSDAVSSAEEEASDEGEDEDEDADEDDSNTDYEDVSDSEGGVEIQTERSHPNLDTNTLFIRNLPFSADDDTLEEHFSQFGKVKYARIVIDHETQKPRGTGFVCFVNEEDATNRLKGLPRVKRFQQSTDKKDGSTITVTHSVLENEDDDPTGKYTMDGRILQITRAVNRNEAARLTAEGAASRFNRDKDKRRLYLLSEGTIARGSPLYEKLSPSEVTMREASAKQRQKLIQTNPSLHLSMTRLSIRNIPRSITSADLKQLARQAIVGFAEDVKAGTRQKLSKEELARGGESMRSAEKERKKKGKGVVKQAKVVFETSEGTKVAEGTGAGRSRGYGFIEYHTHRNALMGLRWLNGHAVNYRVEDSGTKGKQAAKEAMQDRKKRLIVEFAIENASVVHRRSDREAKARDPKTKSASASRPDIEDKAKEGSATAGPKGKRKREDGDMQLAGATEAGKRQQKQLKKKKAGLLAAGGDAGEAREKDTKTDSRKDAKLAQRSRIILRKRMARRAKKAGKA